MQYRSKSERTPLAFPTTLPVRLVPRVSRLTSRAALSHLCFVSRYPRPPSSTLFPYTTLFRSRRPGARGRARPGGRARLLRRRDGRTRAERRCHQAATQDRKSTRLNSSHRTISYAVFCLKKKKIQVLDAVPEQVGEDPARLPDHTPRPSRTARVAAHEPRCALSSLLCVKVPPTTELYTLSLHDALPISPARRAGPRSARRARTTAAPARRSDTRRASLPPGSDARSEEHTSELQSPYDLVCRLLLEKKKNTSSRCSTGASRRGPRSPSRPHSPSVSYRACRGSRAALRSLISALCQGTPDHRALHSFPTRRSSDLAGQARGAALGPAGAHDCCAGATVGHAPSVAATRQRR